MFQYMLLHYFVFMGNRTRMANPANPEKSQNDENFMPENWNKPDVTETFRVESSELNQL